jgi:hypothetical protein
VALDKAAPPPRVTPAISRKDRAFAVEGVKISTAAVLQVLPQVVEGIAFLAFGAFSRRKLRAMSSGVAEPQLVGKTAKITLLILTPLLLLAVLRLAVLASIS